MSHVTSSPPHVTSLLSRDVIAPSRDVIAPPPQRLFRGQTPARGWSGCGSHVVRHLQRRESLFSTSPRASLSASITRSPYGDIRNCTLVVTNRIRKWIIRFLLTLKVTKVLQQDIKGYAWCIEKICAIIRTCRTGLQITILPLQNVNCFIIVDIVSWI